MWIPDIQGGAINTNSIQAFTITEVEDGKDLEGAPIKKLAVLALLNGYQAPVRICSGPTDAQQYILAAITQIDKEKKGNIIT